MTAALVTGQDGPVVARCRTDFLCEGGVEVGTIVALATVERRRGRIVCHAQLAEARVAMEVGERVTTIGERTVTATVLDGGVALFSVTTVSTSRGREWTVLTSTMVVGGEVGEQRVLKLPAVRANGE